MLRQSLPLASSVGEIFARAARASNSRLRLDHSPNRQSSAVRRSISPTYRRALLKRASADQGCCVTLAFNRAPPPNIFVQFVAVCLYPKLPRDHEGFANYPLAVCRRVPLREFFESLHPNLNWLLPRRLVVRGRLADAE